MRSLARTPIALAILRLLHERAMHPYEIQRVMREQHVEEVVKLPRGSLYHAVERLERHGLVEVAETERAGRRPERTVYRITEAGEDTLDLWLRDLIGRYERDESSMAIGLTFMTCMDPADARVELERRVLELAAAIAAYEAVGRHFEEERLPRSWVVEHEYLQAMRRAELAWLRDLIEDLRTGRLTWDPDDRPASAVDRGREKTKAGRRLRAVGGEGERA